MSERSTDGGGREGAEPRAPRAALWAGLAGAAAAAVSVIFFYSRGLTDLYGDALAHLAAARLLFDSPSPGYAQIGTVWLPLPHLLAAPLALNNYLWRTGLAGSLVSAAAMALTAWLLFLLGREMSGRAASGVVAMAVFLLCPSMLYLGSTPLTEPVALLWAVLTVYELAHYGRSGATRPLVLAALAAFCGTLTRYGAWFVLPFAAIYVFFARPENVSKRFRHAVVFALISGAGPVFWLAHNAYRFGNPLEFYNGPYSAKALYARQVATTGFRYPTAGSYLLSARYYLADLVLLFGPWLLELAVLGLLVWALDKRLRWRRVPALMLLLPFPFYVQAMAHAAIPIYIPTLSPYSFYNLRYGIEMLPALGILLSFLVPLSGSRRLRAGVAGALIAIALAQTVGAFAKGVRYLPIVQEGVLNSPCHKPQERSVTKYLRENYHGGRILLVLGEWPCVVPRLGIDLRNTVIPADRKIWKALPQGAGRYVDWIITLPSDPVDELMRAYPQAFRDFQVVFSGPAEHGGSWKVFRKRDK